MVVICVYSLERRGERVAGIQLDAAAPAAALSVTQRVVVLVVLVHHSLRVPLVLEVLQLAW